MKKQNSEKEISNILKRYFNNHFTTEDLKSIITLFTEPGKDIARRITLNSIWSETEAGDFSESKTSYEEDHMLDKINHKINKLEAEKPGIRREVHRNRNFFYFFSRIAAVLFIPLLAAALINLNREPGNLNTQPEMVYTELHAPPFARISFYLVDSTKVWLNNGSTLKYPIDFSGKERKVILSGEAYFDVRKDPYHPFQVEAGDIRIQVKGTRFNVSNYKEDNAVITTLEEGNVLIKKMEQGSGSFTHELTPSRQSIYRKGTRKVQVRNVNSDKYCSWKDGKLLFLDDPMSEAKKKLERWYNVEIIINDPEILDYRYTGTFREEPLEKVLNLMAIATPIRFRLKKGTKQANNTYSKDVITLMKQI